MNEHRHATTILTQGVTTASSGELIRLIGLLPHEDRTWRVRIDTARRLLELGSSDKAKPIAVEVLSKFSQKVWNSDYDGGSRIAALEVLRQIDAEGCANYAWQLLENESNALSVNARRTMTDWHRIVNLLSIQDHSVDIWSEIGDHIRELAPDAALEFEFSVAQDTSPSAAESVTHELTRVAIEHLSHPAFCLSLGAQQCILERLESECMIAQGETIMELESFTNCPVDALLAVLEALALRNAETVRFAEGVLRARIRVGSMDERLIARRILIALGNSDPQCKLLDVSPEEVAPLPAGYGIVHPPAHNAQQLGILTVGEPLPPALHIEELLRIFQTELKTLAELACVQLEALFADVVHRAGGISTSLDDEGPIQRQLSAYELRVPYVRPRAARVRRAICEAASLLWDNGLLISEHLDALTVIFRNSDPSVFNITTSIRPEAVLEIPERQRSDSNPYPHVRDDWPDGVALEVSSLGRPVAPDRTVIAEMTWLRWLDRDDPRETRVGLRMPVAKTMPGVQMRSPHNAAEALRFRCERLSHIPMTQYSQSPNRHSHIFVYHEGFQFQTRNPNWLAIDPTFARFLGWTLSDEGLFRWVDSEGNTMVESICWEDGFFDSRTAHGNHEVGYGWLVVASKSGLQRMSERVGPTLDWKRIDRSLGEASTPISVESTVPSPDTSIT